MFAKWKNADGGKRPLWISNTMPTSTRNKNAKDVQSRLRSLADAEQAAVLARFFKTGPGEYGEGDLFLGIKVPVQRKVAGEFCELPLTEIVRLLHSKIHDDRLTALLILVQQFAKADAKCRQDIYKQYIANTDCINNWDLVDLSAPQIVGVYLEDKSRKPLYRLAKSQCLWERRISILATFPFIRHDDFTDTFQIAETLLADREDLIHKAVGWMLREVGKRDQRAEEDFLKKYYRNMPRTMLRYAIERFTESKRRFYMRAG
jgi:3-methyladenine DNA glycosylase AlkD